MINKISLNPSFPKRGREEVKIAPVDLNNYFIKIKAMARTH
ncbi:MAG: hypothetical protein AABZ36_01785 [Nitrospirota bacterium]